MLAQKVDKGPNSGAYRSVAVVDRTKGHLYWQTFIGHQLDQLAPGYLFINHIIRKTGNPVSFKA